MAKKKPIMTNAMRSLNAAKIPFEAIEYETDGAVGDHFGEAVAEKMGIPPEQSYKTLVGRGDRNGILVVCIPVCCEVDLKKLAAAAGEKKVELIAVKELGVKSPLREAKLTKVEIREYSKELGLPTWDKQSFACLSSRFVYGETISEEKLGMVEKAEQLLLDYGFHQVRVRIHGLLARIEIMPEEFPKLLEKNVREDIAKKFKQYGVTYVTMDILGYRMGSMNETLDKNDKKTL